MFSFVLNVTNEMQMPSEMRLYVKAKNLEDFVFIWMQTLVLMYQNQVFMFLCLSVTSWLRQRGNVNT